ncbi:MAG: hypothetical protein KQH63_06265 [Desulfobulbaceae bacterium]|nr:hypothetical protein [Desulfobulbaceae bacterium]
MLTKKIAVFSFVFSLFFSLTMGSALALSPGQGGMVAVSGKVMETMDSGGYTYVLLENEGQKTWAAIPKMEIAVNNTLTLKPGMVMPVFKSKTLNRTFENIVFSAGPSL